MFFTSVIIYAGLFIVLREENDMWHHFPTFYVQKTAFLEFTLCICM